MPKNIELSDGYGTYHIKPFWWSCVSIFILLLYFYSLTISVIFAQLHIYGTLSGVLYLAGIVIGCLTLYKYRVFETTIILARGGFTIAYFLPGYKIFVPWDKITKVYYVASRNRRIAGFDYMESGKSKHLDLGRIYQGSGGDNIDPNLLPALLTVFQNQYPESVKEGSL